MTTTKPFDIQYEDRVLTLLNDFNSSKVDNAQWKRIWENPWRRENEIPGYILLDDEQVVGFIGLLYGSRIIDGKSYRICNMTSWIVKPEYRTDSLKLVLPILKLKEHTITNLTPSNTVKKIIEKLGFSKTDEDSIILPAIPFGLSASYNISFKVDESLLSPNEKEIYSQNMIFNAKFGMISKGKKYCLFAYNIREKKGIRICHILYVSNPELFCKAALYLRYKLFIRTLTPFIILDSRLINKQKMSFSFILSKRFTKYFKTNIEDISRIDNLNSEFVLLNI